SLAEGTPLPAQPLPRWTRVALVLTLIGGLVAGGLALFRPSPPSPEIHSTDVDDPETLPAGAGGRPGLPRPLGNNLAVFVPGGKGLITDRNGDLILWDQRTGKELRRFRGHQGEQVKRLAVSSDGKLLASASLPRNGPGSHTVRIWDVNTGKELH